jgi:hypothetical protein
MHNFEDDDYSNTWCSISQDMHTQQPQLAMPIAGRAASRLATHRRWLIGAAATATSSAGVGAVKKAQMGELRAIAVNDVAMCTMQLNSERACQIDASTHIPALHWLHSRSRDAEPMAAVSICARMLERSCSSLWPMRHGGFLTSQMTEPATLEPPAKECMLPHTMHSMPLMLSTPSHQCAVTQLLMASGAPLSSSVQMHRCRSWCSCTDLATLRVGGSKLPTCWHLCSPRPASFCPRPRANQSHSTAGEPPSNPAHV